MTVPVDTRTHGPGRLRTLAGRLAFQAGRAVEAKLNRPDMAQAIYRAANRLMPDRPAVLYRLGQVREQVKDWSGAERAYTAAVKLAPPNVDPYLERRIAVRARQGKWAEVVADIKATPGVRLPTRYLPRLASELRSTGDVTGAVGVLESVLHKDPTVKLWEALAECYADLGNFGKACDAYRAAVQLKPDNLTVRTSLGRIAGKRSRTPFEIVDGVPMLVEPDVQEAALAEAIEQLSHVVRTSETRVWTAFWLGGVLEAHGRLADAAEAYDSAVARVQAQDKPWAHHAEKAWRFRHAYVVLRQTGSGDDDVRLARTVAPGAANSMDLDSVPGFFEAQITNNGIFVEGFLRHDFGKSVDICIDGQRVLSAVCDATAWNPVFKTTIVHNVLREFPPTSELSVRAGDAVLVTQAGAGSASVTVPDGSGELSRMLSRGRVVTKKGRWADATLVVGARDQLYLDAYLRAKRFLDEQLGIKLFVCYGTLLGYYRDGRLIPGDDDFDVSFVAEASEPEEFKREIRGVIEGLLRGGFDSRVAVDGRMLHLRVDDVVLDVNPFWFHAGKAWSFDAHDLDRAVFDPAATLTVGDAEIYIPARAEDFLAENYGPDWRTPRPDFQYHRSKADQTVLRRARLMPSEVRSLIAYSEQLRAADPAAGRFFGYGDPANPGFDETA